MKKIIAILVLLIAFRITTHAQAQAYESKIEYQKTMQQVASIDVPCKTDIADDAITDYMKKKGFKASGSKGFTVFRGVKLDDADTELSDLYFKIEKKKKDKDYSIVNLLVTKANMNILARPSIDSTGQLDKAKAFLNNLVPFVEEHNTDVEIGKQQDVLKKTQKKLNGLISDSTDLEKKIRNLLADQAQNKSDILKQTSEIQTTISANDDVKNKAQKKMNKLLDEQDNIAKKIRKTQADLDETKIDLTKQYRELDNQQQVLDAIKAKKKM
jgi:chromosome segregation ATPase